LPAHLGELALELALGQLLSHPGVSLEIRRVRAAHEWIDIHVVLDTQLGCA
jgi:hypothetical protein